MNLRKAPASSMQKTYDECYLTCSTAIYFEGQVSSNAHDTHFVAYADMDNHP